MFIKFKSNKIEKCCKDEKAAYRKWGQSLARKVFQRLQEIDSVQNLKELYGLQHLKCHALTGNRQDQYAIKLDQSWRMVFQIGDCPGALDSAQKVIREKVNEIVIIEVVDYHE